MSGAKWTCANIGFFAPQCACQKSTGNKPLPNPHAGKTLRRHPRGNGSRDVRHLIQRRNTPGLLHKLNKIVAIADEEMVYPEHAPCRWSCACRIPYKARHPCRMPGSSALAGGTWHYGIFHHIIQYDCRRRRCCIRRLTPPRRPAGRRPPPPPSPPAHCAVWACLPAACFGAAQRPPCRTGTICWTNRPPAL